MEYDQHMQNGNSQESTSSNMSHDSEILQHQQSSEGSEETKTSAPAAEHASSEPDDQGYSFISNGTPDGQGYTTPEGAHGFVYAPKGSPKGNGIGKKLIIATCVVGTLLLIMGFCFLGALSAFMAESDPNGKHPIEGSDGESHETPGTTNGFVIVDGTHAQSPAESEKEPSEWTTDGGAHSDDLNAPEFWEESMGDATIQKNEAERLDEDGDGKADIALDENGNVITSAGQDSMTLPTIVHKVAASVVEISTETLVQSDWIGQYITGGAGSGVIIAKEGYIITNHHVVDGADSIVVRLIDGKEFQATLVGSDEQTDVAILWINPGDYELTVATLGASFDLVAGEDIIAIGNPLGSLGGTVTEGIISATEREISVDGNDMTLLQISAPINPGNSGGGLFNMAGELVGVVNAKMSSEEIEGLGFAIPIDTAHEIALELIAHRYVRGRTTTGLTLVDVDSVQTALYYFNSHQTGVYVYESVSDVFSYGDLILSVNGQEIAKSAEISQIIKGMKVGDSVEFVIYRKKKQVTVLLSLMEYVPDYLTEQEEALKPAA